jgi:hypothetical protein
LTIGIGGTMWVCCAAKFIRVMIRLIASSQQAQINARDG